MKSAKRLEEKGVPERDGGRRRRHNISLGGRKNDGSSPFVVFVPFTPTITLVAPAQDYATRPAFTDTKDQLENTLDDYNRGDLFRFLFLFFRTLLLCLPFYRSFLFPLIFFLFCSFLTSFLVHSYFLIGRKECVEHVDGSDPSCAGISKKRDALLKKLHRL